MSNLLDRLGGRSFVLRLRTADRAGGGQRRTDRSRRRNGPRRGAGTCEAAHSETRRGVGTRLGRRHALRSGEDTMASDIFAKVGDVKGESTDAKHKGEIHFLSWSWGGR